MQGELIKNKRGAFFPIHIIAPVWGAASLLGYFHLRRFSTQEQFVDYYVLMLSMYPFMISLAVNMVFKKEEENNFSNILSAPKRENAVLAKLLLLSMMGMIAELFIIVPPCIAKPCQSYHTHYSFTDSAKQVHAAAKTQE